MKLGKFYELINKNAFVTIASDDLSEVYYEGTLKDIPEDYAAYEVNDFCMSDEGDFLFKVTAPAPKENNPWKEGRIEVRGITFHYWAKVFDERSIYGIKGGRISKLSIRNEKTGEEVVNYDRGWDIKPRTQSAQKVVDMLMEKYAG